MSSFSKRQGYINEKPITVQEDAPTGLREAIPQIVYELDHQPSDLRAIVCKVLRVRPDQNNWSEFPNISTEVETLIDGVEWYKVYDIIEGIAAGLRSVKKPLFETAINEYFIENGIGWKLEKGQIEMRGTPEFETAVHQASQLLEQAAMPTAQTEIREAMHDLSRRPEPDITGAIQHAGAALECVAREIAGDPKATLGQLISKHPDMVPKPLNIAIEKIWGFTSEQGRHLTEGKDPGLQEAQLAVELTAAISSYLLRKKAATP